MSPEDVEQINRQKVKPTGDIEIDEDTATVYKAAGKPKPVETFAADSDDEGGIVKSIAGLSVAAISETAPSETAPSASAPVLSAQAAQAAQSAQAAQAEPAKKVVKKVVKKATV
jgi:hypothetical protein